MTMRLSHTGYVDMGSQRFWGHDLDLLPSRDVIGHVTNGVAIVTFLLVVNMVSTLHRYETSKLRSAHFKGQKFIAHARCQVTCRWGVKNDYIFGVPDAILPICYTTSVGLR